MNNINQGDTLDFTYQSYINMLNLLKKNGYSFSSYHDWDSAQKSVILRHDIDNDIDKALQMAKLEKEEGDVRSTYFVLVSSNFYNIFSLDNSKKLQTIISCGHEVGLHFDEVKYSGAPVEVLHEKIVEEAAVLEKAINMPVKAVSMHRPSKEILDANLQIKGLVNSYSQTYFKEFKYLSDSRRRWREPVDEIIASGDYNKLHILTHAFWYHKEDIDMHRTVKEFINRANFERYNSMKENITDIESIISREEVLCERDNY